MASENDVRKFVMAVGVHFPPLAQGDEADVWMASMARVLGRMETHVLSAAAALIIETRNPKRDGKWFPTPSECIVACDTARQRIENDKRGSKPLLSHGERDQSPWASWRCDLADTLIKTPMGERAAAGGWIVTLWNFCREHGRLPSEEQARAMAVSAGDIPKLIEDLESDPNALAQMCARWGRSFVERRQQMAAYVSGVQDAPWRNTGGEKIG